MKLLYKPDWEESQRRFTAWWDGQDIDGPLLALFAPRDKPLGDAPPPPHPKDARQQWLDADYRIAAAEHGFAQTYYAGDAFPWFDTNLGPGSLAIHLGSRPQFDPATVWYHPSFDDMTKASIPAFDPRETYFELNINMARKAMTRLAGKALVSFPDLIENLDILASLRGTNELLVDLVDHPEHVHRLQRVLVHRYFDAYDAFEKVVRDADGGTCFSAFQVWGPGRTAKLQCDMSAMIGVEMFNEFVAPYLDEQASRVDHALYHLDGEDAVKHVDTLCSLPGIDAIQWTPGAGRPGTGDPRWLPLYRRILASGKGLWLLGVPHEAIESIVAALGAHRLMISAWAPSMKEADRLVKRFRHHAPHPSGARL